MAYEYSMIQVIIQAVIEATKAAIKAVREAEGHTKSGTYGTKIKWANTMTTSI